MEQKDPKLERLLIEGWRKMTPGQRIERVSALNEMLKAFAMADVKRMHPDASDWECRLRVASRSLPPELLKKAFGWDVEEQGY